MNQEFTPTIYEGVNKDALISERLTASPNILSVYAFCGTSGLFEYATHGDMERLMDLHAITEPTDKLFVATHVARGIADLHSVGDSDLRGKVPSIAHADIKPSQFVFVGYELKLNDFNLSELLRKNATTNAPCAFYQKHKSRVGFHSC